MPDTPPAVELRAVSKSFADTPVLRSIDLALLPGRVYGLVGENGSGKSTLIKILSGYHRPSRGRVLVAGNPLADGSPAASRAAGLRFVHQDPGLILQMSATENLGLGVGYGRRGWIDWQQQAQMARTLLSQLHVDFDVRLPLAEARAVERTAVAVARAIRQDSDELIRLLVLDEPTATLPPAEVDALFTIIRRSCARGIAVLYVSHRLDEVEEITDEVAVLRDGVLAVRGNIQELGRDRIVAAMVGSEPPEHAGLPPLTDTLPTSLEPPPGRADSVLRVERLSSKRLRTVGLEVRRGEIVGVAGIDGSGREELARAIFGAIKATGRVWVGGNAVRPLRPRSAIRAGLSLVPAISETGSVVDKFSVRENLTLASLPSISRLGRVRRRSERRLCQEWLERLDVRPRNSAAPLAELSGGNRQKVILAKWLALGSPVNILNDPTAGVDVGARARIHQFLADEARRSGTAFVVCSTDLHELESLCSRVVVLREGRIVDVVVGRQISRARILAAMAGRATNESDRQDFDEPS